MTDLPTGHTELSRDPRPIVSIAWDGPEYFKVGVSGVTKIVAYDESGHMSNIPWLAVFKGDEIALRTAADHVAINYLPN